MYVAIVHNSNKTGHDGKRLEEEYLMRGYSSLCSARPADISLVLEGHFTQTINTIY